MLISCCSSLTCSTFSIFSIFDLTSFDLLISVNLTVYESGKKSGVSNPAITPGLSLNCFFNSSNPWVFDLNSAEFTSGISFIFSPTALTFASSASVTINTFIPCSSSKFLTRDFVFKLISKNIPNTNNVQHIVIVDAIADFLFFDKFANPSFK